MLKRLACAFFAYALGVLPLAAQTAPTRPYGTSDNSVATTAFVQANANTPTVPFQKFGAKCDGTTNDLTTIQALVTAHPTWHWTSLVNGVLGICAISGTLSAPNGTWFQDISWKQLAPNTANARTVEGAGAGPFVIIRNTVNRNGAGTDSSGPLTAAGIYIVGPGASTPAMIYLDGNEVYGGGPGMGIFVSNAYSPVITNNYVHDITYTITGDDPCIDQIYGIFVATSNNVTQGGNRYGPFSGTISNGTPTGTCSSGGRNSHGSADVGSYQTDGFDFGGVNGANVSNETLLNVGEAIDIGGTNANDSINLSNISVTSNGSGSFGLKVGHTSTNVNASNITCNGVGYACIVGYGDASGQSAHLHVNGGSATNTGQKYNGFSVWAANPVSGVLELDQTVDISDFVVSNFTVTDTQATPTTQYGFYNQTGTAAALSLVCPVVSVTGGAFVQAFGNFTNGITQCSGGNITQTGGIVGTTGAFGGQAIGSNAFAVGTGTTLFNGNVSWGTSTTRNKLDTISGGNWVSTVMQYDDHSAPNLLALNNYGVTAANDGASYLWNFGTGNAFGAIAGVMSVLATDTWANAGTRSSKFKVSTITAGASGDAFEASTSAFNIPSGSQYKINNTQIAASNLSNGTNGSGAVCLASSNTCSISSATGTAPATVLSNASQFIVTSNIDFSVTGDHAISLANILPTGRTRLIVNSVRVSGASADISAATAGLFTQTGGGGVAIVTGASAITVTASTSATNNNAQSMTLNNGNTETYQLADLSSNSLQWRIGTGAAAGRTADVSIILTILP